MAKILPNWLTRRYLLMAKNFKTEFFSFADAEKFIKKNFGDSSQMVSLILSEFKKAGWLKVEIDPQDSRKRKYSLIMIYNKDALDQMVAEIKSEKHERNRSRRD